MLRSVDSCEFLMHAQKQPQRTSFGLLTCMVMGLSIWETLCWIYPPTLHYHGSHAWFMSGYGRSWFGWNHKLRTEKLTRLTQCIKFGSHIGQPRCVCFFSSYFCFVVLQSISESDYFLIISDWHHCADQHRLAQAEPEACVDWGLPVAWTEACTHFESTCWLQCCVFLSQSSLAQLTI